ncbi:hypothetical protein FB451DRAFT_1037580, partial [Mycena latifolia]
QIFYYLLPADVLFLARLCRPLRAFLMSKASESRHIWRQAFINLNLDGPPLPACPPDLSEVQYASLVFSPHCHVRDYDTSAQI